MSHYDNVKIRIQNIANVSSGAVNTINIDLFRNAQFAVIKQLDEDLYAEYIEAIVGSIGENIPIVDFTTIQKRQWNYQMAEANYLLAKLYIALKKIHNGTVILDQINVGGDSLMPSDIDNIEKLIQMRMDDFNTHLSSATNDSVNSNFMLIIW